LLEGSELCIITAARRASATVTSRRCTWKEKVDGNAPCYGWIDDREWVIVNDHSGNECVYWSHYVAGRRIGDVRVASVAPSLNSLRTEEGAQCHG